MVRVTDETHPIISFQSFAKSSEADVAILRPVYLRSFQRGKPIICLSDARLATHSVDQRRLWADWLAETCIAARWPRSSSSTRRCSATR